MNEDVPIFKSDDSAQIGNFRLVSVLHFFFGRVMYVRSLPFIEKYDLLCRYHFGFGIDKALVFLIDKRLKVLNYDEIVRCVVLELKAFYTLSKNLL